MSTEYLQSLESRRQRAVSELTDMIKGQYPAASFVIGPGIDDETATHITATVDVEDPDEVMDLVIDRLVELQVEEALPISVIPIRTPERVAELAIRRRVAGSYPTRPPSPVT